MQAPKLILGCLIVAGGLFWAAPGQAADTSQSKTTITSAGAINLALIHSNTLAGKKLDAAIAVEENSNAVVTLGTYNTSQIQGKKTAEINEQWASKQLSMASDKVIHNTLTAMENIMQLEKQVIYTEQQRRISETELALTRSKETLGLSSVASVLSLESSYKQTKKSAEQAKLDLAEAKRQFALSLGIGKDSFVLSPEGMSLTPLGNLDIGQIVIRELASNPYVWYYEKQVDNAKLAVVLYDPQSGNSSYKIKDYQASKSSYSLAEYKENLEETLRSAYARILSLEESYDSLDTQILAAQAETEFAEARFAHGMISELARDKATLALTKLVLEQEQALTEHESLLRQLKNPNLLVN